ncbi:EF-hand domain-containing protein 1-like [Diorhabda carinulata]|uniref:EF-hand domain-containing protein 1-like n=1 Tax=Diorhabda carinulata TaxID=1163345 RepID=UPI0025A00C8D|nr:EF-hand domain-containing protein 1-like [Diorhabda carinulata]
MAGIPKLPGFTFSDPTQSRFHVSHTFDIINGYKLPKTNYFAPGGRELDSNSVKCFQKSDVAMFDPSLTYGRTKTEALPQFIPHYVLYSQKCLTFQAFFKQGVVESPNEFYRVRKVNIIYFLEDDTITVMEPRTKNSGIDQGRLVRRGRIPKNQRGEFWHWKDLNVGKDLVFNGVVYHTVDCDKFTREYMASQGLMMQDAEEMPVDPYTFNRELSVRTNVTKSKSSDDKLRRFLEYDGKVLKFKAVWDDRENEYGELMKYEILYFLADDTVSVKEVHEKNDGRDPYPVLLRKMKLPKRYNDTPSTYPAIYLELSDAEVTEYYQPKDFQVGETIFVLGRDMLLYDCDNFTKQYFKIALGIEQKPAIDISERQEKPPVTQIPPHDGLGSLEDSLQNTLTFLPKPPRKDVMKQLLNANKFLRYEMVMDTVHPEDTIRKFVLNYSLADGTCKIMEPPIKNSGILGGKYLQSTLLKKPGSDPLNPDYYSPVDFYIGAVISVFNQRFTIVGADLHVYRYMESNPGKFPCEVIENIRNYMFDKGYLKDDVEDQMKENIESERQWDVDTSAGQPTSDLEKCYKELKVGGGADPEKEQAIKDEIRRQYEESIVHKSSIQPYGVKSVSKECPYPVVIGDVKSGECKEDEQAGEYTSYTPKHIDTPEETRAKYYAGILKTQKGICDGSIPIECTDPPARGANAICNEENSRPIMVAKPDIPIQECKVKSVTFAEETGDRCNRDRNDLCDLKKEKTHCGCTDYQKDCVHSSK